MDALTPLHLILIAAILAVVLGPVRAGRLAGQAMRWLGTYRNLSGRLTPTGLAQALYQAALPAGDEEAGRDPSKR